MAAVDLGRADVALLANPVATRVAIPRLLSLSTPFGRDKTFVRFAGDRYPTAFAGEGHSGSFSLTCSYARFEHDYLADLLHLLQDVTAEAPDPRLLLRTHVALTPGLNVSVVVEVDGEVSTSWAFELVTVTLVARVVQHDVYV